MKKVKIVATLGPATDSEEGITRLAEEGVDFFRLNMSHYATRDALKVLRRVRKVEKRLERPLGVFGDLVGPKIRIGLVIPETKVETGSTIRIQKKQVTGSSQALSLNFPAIVDYMELGAEIYLADGAIKMEVIRKLPGAVLARVLVGGILRSRMGFSAHGLTFRKFKLTAKDRLDLLALSRAGVDGLAISFVQKAKDIELVRKLLPAGSKRPFLIAKIETAPGVRNAAGILAVADALMIARGDLGFGVPLAELPHIQKKLISLCMQSSKPVITATHMLESMIQVAFPTRAEVSDVANAILDGTSAVMLSAETAIGKFPFETVRTMRKIIEGAVRELAPQKPEPEAIMPDAVAEGAVLIAARTKAKLMIAFTESGATARALARFRPDQPILALSPSLATVRALCLAWGVYPLLVSREKYFLKMIETAKGTARRNPVFPLSKGDVFVVSAGMLAGRKGGTNFALVEKLG